ncbi:MAG: ABC transporter substrate-binding protein [Microcoleaceae cyanobacterium]
MLLTVVFANIFAASFIQFWKTKGKLIGLFSLCCVLILSCSQSVSNHSASTSANGDRIIIGTTLKLRTLDPADAYEVLSANMLYNLGDALYDYSLGTDELIPRLATALPAISKNSLVYTIPLRQGVVFHDGIPFNAEAMAFSLRRFMENGGSPSSLLADSVQEIRATGEYELTIQLQKPFAAFTALLAFPGLCAVSPKAYEIGEGKFQSQIFVGTGPYKLTEYATDRVRLDTFENYWGKKPANSGLDIQRLSNSANLFIAFKSGAIDVAYFSLDPDQTNSLLQGVQNNRWQVVTADGNTVNYMALNVNSPPLNQPEVRQALAALVDRPFLNERVLLGQGEPVYSLIPSTLDSYQPVFQQVYGDGNIEQAKVLLKQAGYTRENPAIIELWYPSGSTKRGILASTLKALAEKYLEGLMKLELNSIDATTAYKNLEKGVYPTFMLDWYADFLDADNYVSPFLNCTKGSPQTGCQQGASQYQGSFYYNQAVNQLIAQQRQEQNPQKRLELLRKIQDYLAQDVPYIPLWQDKTYLFFQNNIDGVHLQLTQQVPFWTMSKS